MFNTTARYGVPMEQPKQPQPMSEAARRALRIALAEGKVCWIEWVVLGSQGTRRNKFRLTENFDLEILECGDWHSTGIGADRWLSWSEVREPMVFEFEDELQANGLRKHFPPRLMHALTSGARFRVRYEEILP